MAKSIYVGNLPWSATEEQVQNLFAEHGEVLSVKLVNDRETGRARGFGFVEMKNPARRLPEALDNTSFRRDVRFASTKPNPARPVLPATDSAPCGIS